VAFDTTTHGCRRSAMGEPAGKYHHRAASRRDWTPKRWAAEGFALAARHKPTISPISKSISASSFSSSSSSCFTLDISFSGKESEVGTELKREDADASKRAAKSSFSTLTSSFFKEEQERFD